MTAHRLITNNDPRTHETEYVPIQMPSENERPNPKLISNDNVTAQPQKIAREDPATNRTKKTQSSGSASNHRFVAARRRKITSYFVGNIDCSVTEYDVREYLKECDVKPTHLTMFYGKNGSSARVNVYYEDEATVEGNNFWPEGVTCRRWVSKTEWEKEREASRRKRSDTYRYRTTRNRQKQYNDDDYNRDDYGNSAYSDYDRSSYDKHRPRNRWETADEDDWD